MKKAGTIVNVLAVLVVALAVQFLTVASTYANYGDVVSEVSTLVPGPSGLTWDGQNFWTCGSDDLIYKIASDGGTVLHSIPMPDTGHMANYHPDVAWDGQYLWFFNNCDYNAERAVFQLDPQDGTVLKEFRNEWIEKAGDDGYGLEYADNTLYLNQGSGYNRLIMLSASTGEFVKERPAPGWPRGGMALSRSTAPRELWIGTSTQSSNIAKINPDTGHIHSLFIIDNPISGLAWNGLSLVSIDDAGILRAYDITAPCNPNIITIEPWSKWFCPTQNPKLTWTAECSDSFVIDVSSSTDFSNPQISFPVQNTTRTVMPDDVVALIPPDIDSYVRIRGYASGRFSKVSDVKVINKFSSSSPYCW
jgi:hypothetical protein